MKFSVKNRVLSAVVLGIFFGFLLGPLCSVFKPIASVFGMLVQMVVLPYICFSIIHGLGSIFPRMGVRLFKSSWLFFLSIWVFSFAFIFLIGWIVPKSIPVIVKISSTEEPVHFSEKILRYLIPENPFYDLANSIIPAVAVFGLIIGSALMMIEKKEPLCSILERLIKVFEKILEWLAIISPIGVFAQIAVSIGTIRFETLYQFQFYIIFFILISLFMTFLVFPLLVCSITSMSFKETVKTIYEVCLLPFATGIVAIMIPFLIQYLKKESEGKDLLFHSTVHDKKLHEMGQTILPIGYCFGQIGNCIVVFFLLFLSFYYRRPFEYSETAIFSALSFPMAIGSFSNSLDAVTFLGGYLHFPERASSIFSDSSLITIYFQALMSSAGILTLILLTMHAYYGLLKIEWKWLILRLGTACVAFIALLFVIKPFIHLQDHYANLFFDLKISDVIEKPVVARLFTEKQDSDSRKDPNVPFSNILETGVLKIGYNTQEMPFCYFNNHNELAGYDVAYMYLLANDLDCKLEFVPLRFESLEQELDAGLYDIGISAILMTEKRIKEMDFTEPYDEEDNVLIVPLHRAKEFLNFDQILQRGDLKIGGHGAYVDVVKRHFIHAHAINSNVEASSSLFETGQIDAVLWSKTASLVWCLMNPGFVVIDYEGIIGKAYLSYAVHFNSPTFISFLNNWLLLKKLSGFQQDMRNYWFEGEPVKKAKPRWSVLQNVLKKRIEPKS